MIYIRRSPLRKRGEGFFLIRTRLKNHSKYTAFLPLLRDWFSTFSDIPQYFLNELKLGYIHLFNVRWRNKLSML